MFVLLAAALATHVLAGGRTPVRPGVAVTSLLCAAATLVLVVAAVEPGAVYTVDIGTPASVGLTGGGFGQDISVVGDGRTFVWVEDEVARVRLPRAGWSGTSVHVVSRAYTPPGAPLQVMAAVLNGHPLGLAALRSDWTDAVFRAPRSRWYYGFNVLELRFTYAIAPLQVGESGETRKLSGAIDAVKVGK